MSRAIVVGTATVELLDEPLSVAARFGGRDAGIHRDLPARVGAGCSTRTSAALGTINDRAADRSGEWRSPVTSLQTPPPQCCIVSPFLAGTRRARMRGVDACRHMVLPWPISHPSYPVGKPSRANDLCTERRTIGAGSPKALGVGRALNPGDAGASETGQPAR